MSDRADRLRALLGHGSTKAASLAHGKPEKRPATTPEQDDEILETKFTKGDWNGLVNYLCVACGVGFLDADDAVDHWLAEHSGWTPPPETDIVKTGLVSATGNPIYKEVEKAPDTDKEADE
jgi:hypothetical protein